MKKNKKNEKFNERGLKISDNAVKSAQVSAHRSSVVQPQKEVSHKTVEKAPAPGSEQAP